MTEYSNREYLDEIGSTGMSNVIPGVLTGFGILGTFIGLISGISGFDTASSEVIMGSITTLLGGDGRRLRNQHLRCCVFAGFLHLLQGRLRIGQQADGKLCSCFPQRWTGQLGKNTEIHMLHYQQQ